MADDLGLVGNGDLDLGIFVQHDALAGQAGFELRIPGAVNKILFLFRKFLQHLHALVHINMTGAAGADAAAIVIEVNVVVFRDLQDAESLGGLFHRNGLQPMVFKTKQDFCHSGVKVNQML